MVTLAFEDPGRPGQLATATTAFSTTAVFFYVCRFVTGMGIGGEYSAINSAIDELIPAKHRGRLDIVINGTYWAGAAAGCCCRWSRFTSSRLSRSSASRPLTRGDCLVAFAAGNFLGPIILGGLFDSVGRKPMIVSSTPRP